MEYRKNLVFCFRYLPTFSFDESKELNIAIVKRVYLYLRVIWFAQTLDNGHFFSKISFVRTGLHITAQCTQQERQSCIKKSKIVWLCLGIYKKTIAIFYRIVKYGHNTGIFLYLPSIFDRGHSYSGSLT